MDRIARFAEAMTRVLAAEGVRNIRLDVPGKGPVAVSVETAASPEGLMPAFLAAGNAVMQAATGGDGFAPRFKADPDAVLGYRVADHGSCNAVALLCATDAIRQLAGGGGLAADGLMRVWREACAVAAFSPKAEANTPGPRP